MGTAGIKREYIKCKKSCNYFIHNYVKIYDATQATWIPFKLWKGQSDALYKITQNRLVIILKARQLGMTWLTLGYAMWKMIYHPAVTAMVFSRRDDEAQYLLERMRGMYQRLPEWSKVKSIPTSNAHIWQYSNGSIAYGFPTTAGDSYTASIAIVDEADLIPDLSALMNAVKPTIDGGGEMILLSRADKDEPASAFKNMYRAARDGKSPWKGIFLPWYTRPERDEAWYEDQKNDIFGRTQSFDDLLQQYPATDEEALQARTMDKRLPTKWLDQIYFQKDPLEDTTLGIPALQVYKEPELRHTYVIGADPAEGNPTSDDSSLHVLDEATGEEVAKMADKIEPTTFAEYIHQIARWYNEAKVLVERNNHGHAVIGYISENTDTELLPGWDGGVGWHTTTRGKALLWSNMADAAKDMECKIHSQTTYTQLVSIDGKKLKAPENMHDDEAVSFALAVTCIVGELPESFAYNYIK